MTSNTANFEHALAQVASWPVENSSVVVVDSRGVLASFGDQQRVYPLASVTKPLAAVATLLAVEEGAISLDDDADPQLLPGATLRHLLAHASGLPFDQLRRFAAPGQRRIYSNTGFDLIGSLVAQASGMSFAQYFAEGVAQPLRLQGTVLEGSPAKDGLSCAADLAIVARELLTPTLLHASTVEAARSVQYPGLRGVLPGFGLRDPNDWGLGFEVRSQKSPHWTGTRNSPQTFGHFGQSGTMLWVDPVAGLGLVGLTDRPFGEWAQLAWPALSDAVLQ